jgi:sulfur carrier protein
VLHERNFVFPLLVVRVNGELVPRDQFDRAPVPDGADVQVMHLMSGG